jgi:hypothetical protein
MDILVSSRPTGNREDNAMTTSTKQRIKCRFCDYSLPAYWKTKDGTLRNWSRRMQEHIMDCHPVELEEIRKNIPRYGYYNY